MRNLCATPAAMLAAARPLLSPELVSADAYARVREAVAGLPNGFTGMFLECRLRSRGERADVLLGTLASSRGPAELARARRWPLPLREHPVWRNVLSFFRRWSARRAGWLGSVPLALLELDLDAPAPRGGRLPGFHFCVHPSFAGDGWDVPLDAPEGPGSRALVGVVSEVLALAAGRAPPAAVLRTLARCRRELPRGGRLLHCSAMLSRPGSPYKLNALVPSQQVIGWLRAVGWPGDLATIGAALRRFGGGAPLVKVDLALGAAFDAAPSAAPGPTLGFELSFPGDPRIDPRWRVVVDALVTDGLCSPPQARALADWPRRVDVSAEGWAWPVSLDRTLNVKVVANGGALEAKAYLGLSPSFSLLRRPAADLARPARAPRPRRREAPPFLALGAVLDADAVDLPGALVSPRARARLLDAARALPQTCDSWCIECRLAPGAEQVDLLGCTTSDSGGRAALRPATRGPLARVARLIQRWKSPSSPLYRALPFLWFELDLPPDETDLRAPCIYAGLTARPAALPGGALARDGWGSGEFRDLLDELCDATRADPPRAVRRTAARCLAALPAGGQLNCVGFMLPRSVSRLRLSLELPPGALRAYLAAIGWAGPARAFAEAEALLGGGVDRLALAIEVGATVAPRLGLELFYHRPPALEPRFRAVLACLERRGACAPEKRAALERWRGEVDVPRVGVVDRTVYHVKLVLAPGVATIAKSYLWLTAQSVARARVHARALAVNR